MDKRLIDGNNEFVELMNSNKNFKEYNDNLIKNGQHPYALVITCSDSRVIPEVIFNKTLGELFVIRTAGNVINDGELATIEYAIEHLHINEIIVLAHTYCGAVHAAVHNENGKYISGINDHRIEKDHTLVFTKKLNAKSLNEARPCPNCGHSLNINESGICPYCNQIIDMSYYDYLLTQIDTI